MNFESPELNIEQDHNEYIEKLKAAFMDAVEYADPGDIDDQEYKTMLEKELGLIEEWDSE